MQQRVVAMSGSGVILLCDCGLHCDRVLPLQKSVVCAIYGHNIGNEWTLLPWAPRKGGTQLQGEGLAD
jgi:hypothetical protein